jgi:hypothetical protein
MGVADAACPADNVASPTTVCNPGSGDICDPDESCTGVADAACPADTIAPATTICNAGSGDLCDPDESCTGVADAACPADVIAAATTICNPGSGDICDPDESCTGFAEAPCPADTVAPAGTVCHEAVEANECDTDEECTGVADAPCPPDEVTETCCEITSSSLCPLVDEQFRLIYIQDPVGTNLNNYRLNASNPGQFYYNVFFAGTPGDPVTLTIDIPYPFVTQGAVPIQVHDGADLDDGCFVSSPSLPGCTVDVVGGSNLSPSGSPVILISDYNPQNLGDTTTVTVSCDEIPPLGVLYVSLHLDYGLKKTTGWSKVDATNPPDDDALVDDAFHGVVAPFPQAVTLLNPQDYLFSFDDEGGNLVCDDTASSNNVFKKNPGVNGLTLQLLTTDPKPGVKVQLIGPTGKIVGTTTTDEDGFYQIVYKHSGKAANYTVKLPDYKIQKTIQLKAGGYALVMFENLP